MHRNEKYQIQDSCLWEGQGRGIRWDCGEARRGFNHLCEIEYVVFYL